MSTDTLTPPPAVAVERADGRPTLSRLIHSEWIKFRSLRSSWYTLGAAAAAMLVLSVVIAYNTGRNPTGLDRKTPSLRRRSRATTSRNCSLGCSACYSYLASTAPA